MIDDQQAAMTNRFVSCQVDLLFHQKRQLEHFLTIAVVYSSKRVVLDYVRLLRVSTLCFIVLDCLDH